jgi:TolB-like protein/cytochrome c-type biogenesis protein CcmH/NrfG
MSAAGSGQVLTLGDCLFDRSRGLLLRNDEPVPLRPKAFALLDHLAANCGRVVGKSDLIAAVWPGVYVTEDSLTQAVRELRKALADDDQRTVRTIARRGYLLAPSDARAEVPKEQPVVAILRFTNEGDASNVPVVDGFTEDVMNGLARFRTVTVLARNSSFAFASDAGTDWQMVGGQLGASYLVRGRIRFSAGSLEARVSLIEAAKGTVLWSDAFAASGDGIFALQEEIALKVVNRLVTRLDDASLTRSAAKPTASLAAYEMLQRGLMRLRGYQADDNVAAKQFFEQALDKDPQYALAHSYLALTDLAIGGYDGAPQQTIQAAADRAQLAVTLAPEEPRCHRVLGLARIWNREHEAAEYHFRRSLELNPYDADTIAQMGYLLTMRGRPVEAVGWIERAMRMNPIHPDWYHYDRAMALYSAGDYGGAIDSLAKLAVKTPWRLARLAACHAQLGNLADAAKLVAEVRQIAPDFSPMNFTRNKIAFEHQADIDHMAEGVAKAFSA